MNLPTDKIHDPMWSYGYLLIPWFGKNDRNERNWVGWFIGDHLKTKIHVTDKWGFHNCRVTKVY